MLICDIERQLSLCAFVKLPRLLETGNDNERISIFYEKVSRKDEVVVTWSKAMISESKLKDRIKPPFKKKLTGGKKYLHQCPHHKIGQF